MESTREVSQQRRGQRRVPFGFSMRDPMRRTHQDRTLAGGRNRETDSIVGRAKRYLGARRRLKFNCFGVGRSLGWLNVLRAYGTNKADAFAGNSSDQALLLAVVSDRTA